MLCYQKHKISLAPTFQRLRRLGPPYEKINVKRKIFLLPDAVVGAKHCQIILPEDAYCTYDCPRKSASLRLTGMTGRSTAAGIKIFFEELFNTAVDDVQYSGRARLQFFAWWV
jgi:hypothetical protein